MIGIAQIEKAAAIVAEKPKDSKIPETVPSWYDHQPIIQPTDFAALLRAYKGFTYVCSSKNATAVSSVPLKLYTTKKKAGQKFFVDTKPITKKVSKYIGTKANIVELSCVRKSIEVLEVTDHRLLEVMKKVNPFMNRFELFELTTLYLELTGNCYWYVITDRIGFPAEIWLLPPERMRVVASKEKWIEGYVFTGMDGSETPFLNEEIIHFKYPNPGNLYYGWSPLQAMAHAYNISEAYNIYEQNLMKNNAIPPIALVAPKDSIIGEEHAKAIIKKWNNSYGGAYNSGKAAFLDAGFDVKLLANTPKDMTYDKGRRQMMMEICAAHGVPMSKVTPDNVNKANAEQGDYQYMADTIKPRLNRIEERLNESLTPMVDESLFFMFDNPVPEDRAYMLSERKAHLETGVTVINEERAKLGMEDVDWGERPILANGMTPLPTEEERKQQQEMTQQQLQQSQGGNENQPGKKKPKEEEELSKEEKKIISLIAYELERKGVRALQ